MLPRERKLHSKAGGGPRSKGEHDAQGATQLLPAGTLRTPKKPEEKEEEIENNIA